jgi:hypothetical protein
MVRKGGKEAIPEEPVFDMGEASLNGTDALRYKGLFLDHDFLLSGGRLTGKIG